MKFVGFWEFKLEDLDRVLEKRRQLFAEMEKEPERFAKVIFGGYCFAGETKGFTVYETDDVEKLWNDVVSLMPEMKCTFAPITETGKAIELFQRTRKS